MERDRGGRSIMVYLTGDLVNVCDRERMRERGGLWNEEGDDCAHRCVVKCCIWMSAFDLKLRNTNSNYCENYDYLKKLLYFKGIFLYIRSKI